MDAIIWFIGGFAACFAIIYGAVWLMAWAVNGGENDTQY